MPTLPALKTAACVLAFDTSTELLAVGLQTLQGAFTAQAAGGAAASTGLLPQINRLLARAGVAYADLDAIAFGRGPGAFTGLRTACAVAQGIGLATGKLLLPIDSLQLVAEDARAQTGASDVVVLMDARMDEVYGGRFAWQGGRWTVLQPSALFTLPALPVLWALWQGAGPDVFAGSALAAVPALAGRLGLPADSPRCESERDRASALLRLAMQAAARDEGVDAAAALPLYLRDKVALTTREREAARAA